MLRKLCMFAAVAAALFIAPAAFAGHGHGHKGHGHKHGHGYKHGRHVKNNWDDAALKWAARLARASRLGRPHLDELTRADLETLASNERLAGIDVAGVYGAHELQGMRGHGYFVANTRVSTDVLLSMIYPFDPAWRGLVHGPGRTMWTFPDDYPQRVGDALYSAVPELRRSGS